MVSRLTFHNVRVIVKIAIRISVKINIGCHSISLFILAGSRKVVFTYTTCVNFCVKYECDCASRKTHSTHDEWCSRTQSSMRSATVAATVWLIDVKCRRRNESSITCSPVTTHYDSTWCCCLCLFVVIVIAGMLANVLGVLLLPLFLFYSNVFKVMDGWIIYTQHTCKRTEGSILTVMFLFVPLSNALIWISIVLSRILDLS